MSRVGLYPITPGLYRINKVPIMVTFALPLQGVAIPFHVRRKRLAYINIGDFNVLEFKFAGVPSVPPGSPVGTSLLRIAMSWLS